MCFQVRCNFSKRTVFSGQLFISMKTYSIIAFLAALVAFVVSPLSLEVAGSLLSLTGLVCILIGDYTRPPVRSMRAAATIYEMPPRNVCATPAFELAA